MHGAKTADTQVEPVTLWLFCSLIARLFEMDDIQVVESKPLLVDKELPVCTLHRAKSGSEV